MSQIKHMLVERFVEELTQRMSTEVSGATKANVVKAYRFQEDPLTPSISLWVTTGDPDKPADRDARISAEDMEMLSMRIPVAEVGGGHLWWRKGKVEIECFFILNDYDQETSGDYAHTVLGRTMHWLERTYIADLVDDYGEQAIFKPIVYASTFFEGGGPPADYIWRGSVYWQVLTHRPM